MILLNIAGVLSCIAYGLDKTQPLNLYLGIVLFVVVFLTCVSSYFQERNSSNVMNVFGKMLARQCKVVRDGHEQAIDVQDLVPGDIVRVQGGTVVPADLRLLKVSSLKVEASSLTGETDPIQCTVEATHDIARESANIAFNSAQCLEGEAVGIVIRTGDNTVIGRIAALAGGTDAVETTFQKEVKRVVYIIAAIAFSTAIVFFAIGMLRGQPFVSTFVNGFILVIVANIPQGLPATVTSLLTLTANRMGKKHVLVKKLECVETLGSCTVIASDKTGTLTENKMHVEHVWFDYHSHTAGRITDRPTQAFKSVAFNSLYRVAALCNRAHFEEDPDAAVEMPKERENRALTTVRRSMEFARDGDGEAPAEGDEESGRRGRGSAEMRRPGGGGRRSMEWTRDTSRLKIVGDASETAIFRFCNQVQPIEAYQEASPKVFEIPFNSTNKWQLSIHKVEIRVGDKMKERRLLVMKGAPEILMSKCSHVLSKGERTPIDNAFRDEFDSAYKRFGSYGERVLAFAELELDPKTYKPSMDSQYDVRKNNFPTSGLTFVGLISLMDPPRKGVKEAIESCHGAGIRVIMVTGDHPFTAEAIAKKVGIIGEYLTAHDIAERDGIDIADVPDEEVDAVVAHGHTLVNYKQEDWDRILSKHEIVFARTSPQQKLQIVENLQRLEEIVAVTGDGVNDSPALRRADIGVAMGICGSDVAKEAADIILTDDNFASIVSGIREGRIIFDNLKKTIAYTLTHLLPELIPVLLNLAGSLPLALGSLLILVIDLGTELAPAVSLAYEKPEADIMSRPPRDAKKDRLITWQLLVYSYFIAGAGETLCSLLAYFMVYYWNGIPASSLPGAQGIHFLAPSNSSEYYYNDYGRIYSPDEQFKIFSEAQTSYFITLVMCQFCHIWMCKTRTRSLITHGIGNMMMNFGVIIEVALCVMCVPFIVLKHLFAHCRFPVQCFVRSVLESNLPELRSCRSVLAAMARWSCLLVELQRGPKMVVPQMAQWTRWPLAYVVTNKIIPPQRREGTHSSTCTDHFNFYGICII